MASTIAHLNAAIRERLDYAPDTVDGILGMRDALYSILAQLETAPADHSCRACDTALLMRGEIVRSVAKTLGIDDGDEDEDEDDEASK